MDGPVIKDDTTRRRLSLVILFVVSGALLYPCLSFFLFEPDEGRYAQIPREMLTRGEWIVPTLQGEPYLDKPPLFYWLVMAAYQLFGFHDWAARLIPALAVQGCILLTYVFGRRLLGERPAFWGALVLAMMPGFVGMGRLLVLDGVLTFWVTLSVYSAGLAVSGPSFRRGYWLLAAFACGLGVLTKGPVAVLLLLPAVVLFLWLRGCFKTGTGPLEFRGPVPVLKQPLSKDRPRVGWRNWLLFITVALAVAAPWYVLVSLRSPDFARHFFLVHNVQRFVQPFDHDRPLWFYIPVLLVAMLPATLLIIPWIRFQLSQRISGQANPILVFLLGTAGWCVLFFSLAGSKLPTYILPALPLLSLAFGAYLAQVSWNRSRWFLSGLGAWWVLSIVGHGVAVPALARARSPMADWERMTKLCGDPKVPVICFPRHVDSVAFYVGRADFPAIHTRDMDQLLAELAKNPRTVILFGHRTSLESLKLFLPTDLQVVDSAPMGLCDWGVVQRRKE